MKPFADLEILQGTKTDLFDFYEVDGHFEKGKHNGAIVTEEQLNSGRVLCKIDDNYVVM